MTMKSNKKNLNCDQNWYTGVSEMADHDSANRL